ncbi:uncharacterized protein LOC128220315 [Mya arenaria]|uniref:uncharacterized protein LOC128220315 n=1 Tax=Mya arenaria TaxID=6604 RepID=UPI0022E3062D|nr:uncharacterized protein LOC128220315 [Mya arenaria]
MCPGNLQLLAARVVNKFMTEPVVNNSLMQIELTCIESNGASQIAPPPPTFQWFRRTTRGQLVFKILDNLVFNLDSRRRLCTSLRVEPPASRRPSAITRGRPCCAIRWKQRTPGWAFGAR